MADGANGLVPGIATISLIIFLDLRKRPAEGLCFLPALFSYYLMYLQADFSLVIWAVMGLGLL